MSTEEELRSEIERLTSRVRQLESLDAEMPASRSASIVTEARPRAKPDVFSAVEESFNDWLNHFELCAKINGWSNEQSCQQLAVCLRGRAQRVYTTLSQDDKNSYTKLVAALRLNLEPPQQRAIHKLAFRNRQRNKSESLVDLATDLRRLAARAFPNQELATMEEELIEQFVSTLNSRELRLGISQTSPETLDTALQTALKLETLFAVENSKKISEKDTEVNMAYHAWSNQTTPLEHAQINTAGSKDEKLPQWAKEMLERQTVLFERLLAKNERTERSRNDACYVCGQPGHFKRNCPQRFYQDNQGNAFRAGLPRK